MEFSIEIGGSTTKIVVFVYLYTKSNMSVYIHLMLCSVQDLVVRVYTLKFIDNSLFEYFIVLYPMFLLKYQEITRIFVYGQFIVLPLLL